MLFDRIKEVADERGISISELSVKMGWSEKAIYAWKTSSPSLDKVKKIADYFGISIDRLADRDEYWRDYDKNLGEEKLASIRNKTDEASEAMELFAAHIDDDLTPEEMEDVIQYLEFIRSKHKNK